MSKPSAQELVVIEAPANLGLKAPEPGRVPGVNRLPAWFREHGLHERLGGLANRIIVPAPAYTGELDVKTGVRQADAVVDYARRLARVVSQTVGQQQFSFVLGGDCSILLGCLLGLPVTKSYGLFFLDGHTDFAWPGLSKTGAAAGMDLALVTGHGPLTLIDIDARKPYVAEEQVYCVGNRDTDPAYVAAIESSSISYWSLERLRKEGISRCVRDFLQMVTDRHLAGFWIHLDVDVLDDRLMPAVDSRQLGGLLYMELVQLLTDLLRSGKALGMDITILDPDLDASGQYTRQFIQELTPVWKLLTTPVDSGR